MRIVQSKTATYALQTPNAAELPDDNGIFHASGVYIQRSNKKGELFWAWIASPFYISKVIDAEEKQVIELVFFDQFDKRKTETVSPRSVLQNLTSGKNAIVARLQNRGLTIKDKTAFQDFVFACESVADCQKGTTKTGWQDGEYVNRSFSTASSENAVQYVGDYPTEWKTEGNKENQFELFRNTITENPLVAFICGYCLSSYMATHLSEEINPLLAIVGHSSKGKTMVGQFALSMMTDPASMKTFGGTAGALMETIYKTRDSFVLVDEIGQTAMSEDQRKQWIYNIANGQGRERLRRDHADGFTPDNNERAFYSVLFTGEKSLLQGTNAPQGLNVRLNEVMITETLPVWQSFEAYEDEAEKQRAIASFKRSFYSDYGHIARAFVLGLKDDLGALGLDYHAMLERVREGLTDDAVSQRKAKMMGMSLYALKRLALMLYADDMDAMGTAENIVSMAHDSAKRALFTTATETTTDGEQYLNTLTSFVETWAGYFNITPSDPLHSKTYAEKAPVMGEVQGRNMWIYASQRDEFARRAGVDWKRFLTWADDKGILLKDKHGKADLAKTINNKTHRVYGFDLGRAEELIKHEDDARAAKAGLLNPFLNPQGFKAARDLLTPSPFEASEQDPPAFED